MAKTIDKARYWQTVLYPENMVESWEDVIGDVVQLPYAYAIHDKDRDKNGELRKAHVHMILVFPNTTTYKHALSVFKLLGDMAVNTCEACISVRHSYDYLLHDTDACRKQGKVLYPEEARKTGNNFDIGLYEQVSVEEKQEMLRDILGFILERKLSNMTDFYLAFTKEFPERYWSVVVGYNGIIDKALVGNWRKYEYKKNQQAVSYSAYRLRNHEHLRD